MAKTYWFQFGSQDPRSYTGLSPTFIQFVNQLGATLSPPGITESPAGFGFYRANYTVGASTSVAFLIDGGATLSNTVRYISGNIFGNENLDYVGSTLLAIGSTTSGIGITLTGVGITLTGIGNTLSGLGSTVSGFGDLAALIGNTTSSFGSTNVDPGSLFGYVKRAQEVLEGNQTYLKSSGAWAIYSRGSSTLLATKTLSQDVTGVTRL